jgi:hypothetical protein
MSKHVWRPLLGVVLVLACGAALAQTEVYRLAEDDELRLIAPNAPGIAGAYRLGEDGRIALPISGTLLLGGLTLDEAAERVRAALQAEIVAPVIGIELQRRRPFYITGDVASPGAYPGIGGLTLARAAALAGGDRRNVESDRLQLAVTEIRSREELDKALRERAADGVRLARLEAELAGSKEFAAPPTPEGFAPDEAAALIAREAAILTAGADAYVARLEGIARLLTARKAEITALEGRLEASARQTALIDEEIADVRTLVDRGLAPVSRLNSLLREADRQQGDVLQIRVLLNQALQAVAQLELDQANVPRERTITLTETISETLMQMSALSGSITAASEQIEETGAAAPAGPAARVTRYRVQREDGSAAIETEDGSQPVFAGDLVTVLRGPRVPGAGP